MMNYDKEFDLIIFDHLISESDEPDIRIRRAGKKEHLYPRWHLRRVQMGRGSMGAYRQGVRF